MEETADIDEDASVGFGCKPDVKLFDPYQQYFVSTTPMTISVRCLRTELRASHSDVW